MDHGNHIQGGVVISVSPTERRKDNTRNPQNVRVISTAVHSAADTMELYFNKIEKETNS